MDITQKQDELLIQPMMGHKKIMFGLMLGTALEWYDFAIYSGLSSTISSVFFPSSDPVLQDIALWGVFAVGFIVRPLGSVVFGHIADACSRKLALVSSIVLMALATMLIGCIPSYNSIGVAAPVLLAILRALQGFAMGGEYGTSIMYACEIGHSSWQGRISSIMYASSLVGQVVGLAIVMILQGSLSGSSLEIWGWRVPFLLAIVTGSMSMFLRMSMPEPPELITYKEKLQEATNGGDTVGPAEPEATVVERSLSAQPPSAAVASLTQRTPFVILIKGYWDSLVLHVMFEVWYSMAFYAFTAWMPSFYHNNGVSALTTQGMQIASLFSCAAGLMLIGYLCDKRLPCMPNYAVAVTVGSTILIGTCSIALGNSLAGKGIMLSVQMAIIGVVAAIFPISGFSLYPVEVRATGFNLGHNISSLIGGFTPLMASSIQALLPSTTGLNGVYAIAFVLGAAGLVSIVGSGLVFWFKPEANYTRDVYNSICREAAGNNGTSIGEDSSVSLSKITSKLPLDSTLSQEIHLAVQ